MAKEKSSKKKGQGGRRNKRLGNAASSSSAGAAGSGKRGNKKRGKRTPNVGDARTTVKRQQTRGRVGGRVRQGNPAPLIRRQLGAGIRDARQIINSHQGVRRRASGGRTFVNSNLANGMIPQLASSAFSDAVRAAIAPIVAPLLRGAAAAGSRQVLPSSLQGGMQALSVAGNGPCALRVANLAQSVTTNDLAELFQGYPGFAGAEIEGPGIALISFERRESAVAALDEYNNRELDGRTMMIQMDSSSGASSRLGPKPQHATASHQALTSQSARSLRTIGSAPSTSNGSSLSRQTRADMRWNEIRSDCDM